MWVEPEIDPRQPDDNVPKDERGTYVDYLRHYRLTLEMKCEGLSPEQMATRSVPPSTMSLLGLVRHLAEVERAGSAGCCLRRTCPALGSAAVRRRLGRRGRRRRVCRGGVGRVA